MLISMVESFFDAHFRPPYCFSELIFVGVEEDEVFTLDYPMDSINGFFNPLENTLHQILANQFLHQDIFANFCVRDFSN